MLTKITQFCQNHNLIPTGSKIVVGFSGGPDSMLLLHFLSQLKQAYQLSLIAVHLDHGWRTNSASDVIFCKTVCDTLDIPFVSAHLKELAIPEEKLKGSSEEVGRHARRFLLEKVAREHKADRIALGQHLDDQEETFIIRLIRGSTLSGLTAMKPLEGIYVRPLLEVKKLDLVDYLDAHAISYLIDPTNDHDTYLRNRIRKYVIPALRTCDDRFDHNFLRALGSLQSAESYLVKVTKQHFNQCAHESPSGWHLDTSYLNELDSFMQYRVLLEWLIQNKVSFTPTKRFLNEIMRFMQQPGSKTHTMHHAWFIKKKKNILTILKLKNKSQF